jgi:glycosyltransferase involved in cell wall biosynthesis
LESESKGVCKLAGSLQKDRLRVGALVANYNNGKEIKDCLDGLANQTRKPDVIFIIDDGSTDGSQDIIINLTESHSTVLKADIPILQGQYKGITTFLVAFTENHGPSTARNIGLKYLINNTDYICIADADDIYKPTKIEKSLNIFKQYNQIALVYSDYDVFNLQNKTISREFKEPFSFKRLFEECIVSNNSIIASEIFKIVGGYDESLRYGEDWDLWLRIAENACLYHIPESLYVYTLTGKNSTIVTPPERFAIDVNKVRQKAIVRRDRGLKDAGF